VVKPNDGIIDYNIKNLLKSIFFHMNCHNPSLGLATKARACKVAGQKEAQD
jgi:hypothetical protein